jgi:hypothetical protein
MIYLIEIFLRVRALFIFINDISKVLRTNQSKQQLFLLHNDVVQLLVHPSDDNKTMSRNEEKIEIHIKQANKTTNF